MGSPSIITRDKARALGLARYFTGKPCKHGHVAERYASGARSYRCIECREDVSLEYRTRPDKRVTARDRARAFAAARNGFTPPPLEKDCPPRPSDGRCDCCLRLVPGGRFHLDHDHELGFFRGWTCGGCNTGHGIMDDPDRLRRRAEFLEFKLPWQ